MKSHTHYLWFTTKQRQEIIDITEQVAEQVRESGVAEGLALVSAMHITASVFVNDHESGLWADILKWLETTIAPWDPKRYRHNETGEDNAAAHLRSLTIGHEVIVPITASKRSEEHTSELQSRLHLVCRLLLEKKKKSQTTRTSDGYALLSTLSHTPSATSKRLLSHQHISLSPRAASPSCLLLSSAPTTPKFLS